LPLEDFVAVPFTDISLAKLKEKDEHGALWKGKFREGKVLIKQLATETIDDKVLQQIQIDILYPWYLPRFCISRSSC